MAKYIKANPLVAKYLGLESDRNTVADGNYLLWQGDMTAFGRLSELYDIAPRIGAVVLEPYEARQEQDGTVLRPLPVATDARFVTDAQKAAQSAESGEENSNVSDAKERAEDITNDTESDVSAIDSEKGGQA